jgi:hypothetical protein
MALIFTNHAGTLSDSFAIGKRGIKLLQGEADPTGVVAPTGSLYVRRDESIQRVFQIDSDGVWHRLMWDTDIPTTKYKQSFTSDSLSNGTVTFTHNLNEEFPIVQIYDDSKRIILPDSVTSVTANSVTVDITSFGSISGTWQATIIAS